MTHKFPKDFSLPVLELISLGEQAARGFEWLSYATIDIRQQHIPELLRIIENSAAFWPEGDADSDEVYAPVHAWRALGQLKAQQAIQPLIDFVEENEELAIDWIMDEVPIVMGMIGPVSIPALQEYLCRSDKLVLASGTVANCLAEVGQQNPESRADCITALQAGLENYATTDEAVNGFVISYLADLKAVEAVLLVEEAYKANKVDKSILGDFEDYQIAVGLLEERQTPQLRYQFFVDPRSEQGMNRKTRRKEERRKRKQAKKTRRGKRRKKRQ
jgi:hypothetical protein